MALYLDGKTPSEEQIRAALRRATIAMKAIPVTMGAAFKNKGVQPLLDAVVDFLPSPGDIPPVKGTHPDDGHEITRRADDKEPFAGLAFKIMNDPFVGQLTFFRVYSGVLEAGSTVYNSTKGKRERIGRLLRMHANKREEIKDIVAGNIAAAVGLRVTTTGDTLCDEKAPIILEAMQFAAPVISQAIEPSTKADQDKMGVALQRLSMETPRSASTPTRRRGRPSSRAWASCTSRSSSTACGASSRSRPPSASRRWPTARPSPPRSSSTTGT